MPIDVEHAAVKELRQLWESVDGMPVAIADVPRARVAAACAENAFEQGFAALTLWNSNVYFGTAPLARACFESALFAAWAQQDSNDVVDHVAAEVARQHANVLVQLAAAGIGGYAQKMAGYQGVAGGPLPQVQGSARSVQNLCSFFKEGDLLYSVYRVLSGQSHALVAIDRFVELDGQDLKVIKISSPDPSDAEPAAHFILASLIWAARARDELDNRHPLRGDLDRLADANKIGRMLVRK